MSDAGSAVEQARVALERFGLLLFSDPALPSLVGLIVGEPLRASWWGHPRGGVIYEAMNVLDDDPTILSTKLVAGKVTYVHERLWPSIYTLGASREEWQLGGLSAAAQWLLGQVDAEGELRTDHVYVPPEVLPHRRVADAARELERRLLVHAAEVHTESGAHAKVLQTWPRWADNTHISRHKLRPGAARAELEAATSALSAETEGGVALLPWQTPSRARRR